MIFLGVWLAANFILLASAVVWAFFHPRAVHSASQPALRWAFVGSLFGSSDSLHPRRRDGWRIIYTLEVNIPLRSPYCRNIPVRHALPFSLGLPERPCHAPPLPAFWLRKHPQAEVRPRRLRFPSRSSWLYFTALLYLVGLPSAADFFGLPVLFPNFPARRRFSTALNGLYWGGSFPVIWITLYFAFGLWSRPRPLPAASASRRFRKACADFYAGRPFCVSGTCAARRSDCLRQGLRWRWGRQNCWFRCRLRR